MPDILPTQESSTYSERKGASGGTSDIGPEPNGLQNGTAPLQNASLVSGAKKQITPQIDNKAINKAQISALRSNPLDYTHLD